VASTGGPLARLLTPRLRDRGVEIKTPEQIEGMRAAGLVVGRTLELLAATARDGMTTGELDRVAEDVIRSSGAVPSFLGYSTPPYPATICASVNEEIVHGIPGPRVLRDGDLLSIDCGAIVDGWHGDAAVTVAIGAVPDAARELMRVTEEALWAGIAAARLGGRVGDISSAVESSILSQGRYGIVEDYTGHGIGSAMHQPPDVPNRARGHRGPRLVEGLALAVEPMVVLGSQESVVGEDEWTVVTVDGSLAAHFEHTFTLTPNGAWVLTALDGGRSRLAALGVPCGAP
jgi:methionyl aminopeptidase